MDYVSEVYYGIGFPLRDTPVECGLCGEPCWENADVHKACTDREAYQADIGE